MNSLAEQGKQIEDQLRLRTRIIGFKRMWKKDDLECISNIERIGHYNYFCQLLTYCRTKGVPIGATLGDIMPSCSAFFGLREIPPEGQDGTIYMATWVATREDAKRRMDSISKIPADGHEAILLSPLSLEFDPEVILAYGTPAQMQFIINAIQLTDYEVLQFYSVGESACTDSLVRCYLTGKPHLSIPCYGERRLGQVAEDELVFAIPPNMMQKIADNLAELFRRGLTYPIRSIGMSTDPLPHQNLGYRNTWFNPMRK
jgi:uncharacterized protein (DUF169 family)